MHGRFTQVLGPWEFYFGPNHGWDYDRGITGPNEMRLVGLCMLVWAWMGHGWYFGILGWVIFEYGSLNEGVVGGRKDGKIQTVRKLDE